MVDSFGRHLMNRLKTYSLAALLPLLLIASLSADTPVANGTTLCAFAEVPCPFHFSVGAEMNMSLAPGTPLLKEGSTSIENECQEAEIRGNSENAGGSSSPVEVNLSALSLGECSCSVTILKRGQLSIENIEGTQHGRVRWSGLEIEEECGSFKCLYAGEASNGITLRGGSEPSLTLERTKMPTKSFTCFGPNWSGAFKLESPAPLYVTGSSLETFSGQGTLCGFFLVGSPCPNARKVGAEAQIAASLAEATTSVLEAGIATVTCGESEIEGEVLVAGTPTEPTIGTLTSWSFGKCNCEVQPTAGSFVISWTTGNDGAVELRGYEIAVRCGGKECIFGRRTEKGIAVEPGEGSTPPTPIRAKEAPMPKIAGSAECSSTAAWSAEYKPTTPLRLYLLKE